MPTSWAETSPHSRWHQHDGEEFEIGPDFLREQKFNTPDRDGMTRPQAPRRPAPPTPFQLARNAETSPMPPLESVLPRPLPELVQCPSPPRPRSGSAPHRRAGSPSPSSPPPLLQRKNSFIQPTKPVSPLSQCSQRSGSVGRTSLDGFTERRPHEQVRSATLPLNRSKNSRTATVHVRSMDPKKCSCLCCIENSQQTQTLKEEMEILQQQHERLQQQHERLQHQHRILQQQMEQQQQLNEDTIRGHDQIKALEIEQLKQKYERQLALQAELLEKEFELVLQKSHSKR